MRAGTRGRSSSLRRSPPRQGCAPRAGCRRPGARADSPGRQGARGGTGSSHGSRPARHRRAVGRSELGVVSHRHPLVTGQRRRLGDDRVGDARLADVVQQSREAQSCTTSSGRSSSRAVSSAYRATTSECSPVPHSRRSSSCAIVTTRSIAWSGWRRSFALGQLVHGLRSYACRPRLLPGPAGLQREGPALRRALGPWEARMSARADM